ncbi:hypothetical protein HZI73_18675 [Vallitalea pronyensis]|uniref:Uncharacterized protein n=1 Tax=Vallitalea pronyensis TaxID=1348613 RepID=A0A8J8SHT1_9FIRM|nr:hypothetical protein [Vallitalea pronyensis]QUI24190.1 hypothetical protein HZI73_18675 [Vallitalea pronyensis]
MICENMIGKSFNSLAERFIYPYKALYTEFVYVNNSMASEESQKQMYKFLDETIDIIYKKPSIIDLEPLEDSIVSSADLRKFGRKFFAFFELLYDMGIMGCVEDNVLMINKTDCRKIKKSLIIFQVIGISCEQGEEYWSFRNEKYPLIFPAWKELSIVQQDKKIPKTNKILNFIFARYSDKQVPSIKLFGELTGNKVGLNELEKYFIDNGFVYSNKGMQYTWMKEYPKKVRARFMVQFFPGDKEQIRYDFIIPYFKVIMHHFNQLDKDTKEFVLERTKDCNKCRFCIQMDKTKKREILSVNITYNEKTFNKCPLFPNWSQNKLNEKEVVVYKKLFNYGDHFYNNTKKE